MPAIAAGPPRFYRHTEGPLMSIQLWTLDDGTRVARVICPWRRYKLIQGPWDAGFQRLFAAMCSEVQPFTGEQLSRFLQWRARLLSPPTDSGQALI